MPLYTYVTTYRGSSYVAQARRSNHHGFGDWIIDKPKSALPELRMSALGAADLYGPMNTVPNKKHVWTKTIVIDGSELVVVAIQTVG